MTPPVLRVSGLVVRYGRFTALHGLDAEFSGGALGLLGPNGAGKSSLMRAVLGLVPPTRGRVELLGRDPKRHGAKVRRSVGYMPERDSYVAGMSCVRVLAHLAEVCGIPPQEAMMRAHDLLHFAGLGEERYREISTFSLGMRQRFKLAAALVHDPDLLLLDEPTNGLDPVGRRRMLALVRRVHQEHGKHVVLASHLLPDVEELCDQVWVMDRGRLVKSDSVEHLTRAARGAKRVRLSPNDAPRLRRAAEDDGLRVEAGRSEGELVLSDPDDVLAPRRVFALASRCGCRLYAVQPAARSLEDAFLEALEARTVETEEEVA